VVETLNLNLSAKPRRLPVIGNFLKRYNLPDPGWRVLGPYAWHNETIELGWLNVPENLLGKAVVLTTLANDRYIVDLGLAGPLNGQVGEMLQNDAAGFALLVNVLDGAAGRQFILQQKHVADVLGGVRNNLSIREKGRQSSILRLVMKGEDPENAVMILDQILRVYLLQNQSRNAAEAESSLVFIQQQLPEARAQVRGAEDKLNAYKMSQNSVDLSFETLSMLQQSIDIETLLNELALQEQELQKRFTQSHPAYRTLLDNRAQLDIRLAEIGNKTEALPETQLEMLRMTLDLEVAQEIFVQLVSRAQELNVIKAGTLANIRVIDTALADPAPITPNKKRIGLLAAVLGLMLSLAFVLIRSFMARGIQSTEEIEQLGIPVYASIQQAKGRYEGAEKKRGRLKILAQEEPTNITVEALRSLRTSLHFGMLDAKSSLLLVTGAIPKEGKSFVSVNLATVMATAGQNICLVDVDIRRGYLRRYFGVEKSAPGLTDILAGNALAEDVIQQDKDSGLYFITTGKYPPNPSEMLMHKRFGEIVGYLDKRFDITILDSAPVLAVTDPIIIGKYAAMILLVVNHLTTSLDQIQAAQKVLANNNLKFTGAVLNHYDAKKSGAAYSYSAANYQYEYKSRGA
jgi:tyrosine-protein kinase Etk/Wzc